jgi:hypothetical protein
VQRSKWVRGRTLLNNVLFWCSMILGLSMVRSEIRTYARNLLTDSRCVHSMSLCSRKDFHILHIERLWRWKLFQDTPLIGSEFVCRRCLRVFSSTLRQLGPCRPEFIIANSTEYRLPRTANFSIRSEWNLGGPCSAGSGEAEDRPHIFACVVQGCHEMTSDQTASRTGVPRATLACYANK